MISENYPQVAGHNDGRFLGRKKKLYILSHSLSSTFNESNQRIKTLYKYIHIKL